MCPTRKKLIPILVVIMVLIALGIIYPISCRSSCSELTTYVYVADTDIVPPDSSELVDVERPSFLVFFVTDHERDDLDGLIQTLWEHAAKPQELSPHITRSGGASTSSGRFHIGISTGNTPESIGGNLDSITQQAGNSSWKKQGNGYLVFFGSPKPDIQFNGLNTHFPPAQFLVPNLSTACQYLSELTGIKITISAKKAINRVEWPNPFARSGMIMSNQFFLETTEVMTFKEFISALAHFHGSEARFQDNEVVIDDPSPEEIKKRVSDFIDEYHRSGIARTPEPRSYGLPYGAEQELLNYLDTADSKDLNHILWTLYNLDRPVDRQKLLAWLEGKNVPKGLRITKDDRDLIAQILGLMGEEAAIPYLRKAVTSEYRLKEIICLTSRIRTQAGANFQKELLGKSALKKPGKLEIESKPEGITEEEIHEIENLVVTFIERTKKPDWGIGARGSLRLTSDGQTAFYKLSITEHYGGPLAAGGTTHKVILHKYDKWWFIISGGSSGSWVS